MNKLFLVVLLFAVLQATYCSPAKRNWDNELKEKNFVTEPVPTQSSFEYSTEPKEHIKEEEEQYNPLKKEYFNDNKFKDDYEDSSESEEVIVEGDIKLTPVQAAIFKESGWDGLVKSEAWVRKAGVWPRVIPYTTSGLHPPITAQVKQALMNSIAMIQQHTCLRFVQRTTQPDYLQFIDGGSCSSHIGKRGGAQTISLAPLCLGVTPAHEIMHALGRLHEQSRPDRDDYVTINFNNIRSDMAYNFNKTTKADVDTQGIPYDYSSLMHYGRYAFTKNGQPTITPLHPPTAQIGQRFNLSEYDIMHTNIRYCPERMVRLVNGRTQNEGRVEVNWKGQWGTICDDEIDFTDGNVICKYLGYSSARAVFKGAQFGQGTGPILFDGMQCSGNEQSPYSCPKTRPTGIHNCDHSKDVGVICQQ